jgi:hypothetical protein
VRDAAPHRDACEEQKSEERAGAAWGSVLAGLLRAARSYVADVPTNGAGTLLQNIDGALTGYSRDADAVTSTEER